MALDETSLPFQILSAEEIAEQLAFDVVGHSAELTDLNIGGILRALVEALGIQKEQLYSKMFFGLLTGMVQSFYAGFEFPRLGAVKTSGIITFNRESLSTGTITIPEGFTIVAPATATRPAVSFVTLDQAVMLSGHFWIEIPIAAVEPGAGGNVAAGRITRMSQTLAGIDSIINFSALSNGADEETDEQRKVRFRNYVQSLARSTLQGIETGALTAQILDGDGEVLERVQKVIAVEPGNTLGTVVVYIDNGGGTASTALIAEAQRIITGYRDANGMIVGGYKAAGIVAEVAAILSVTVAVTAAIEIEDGFEFLLVKTDVEDAITVFFQNLNAGGEVIVVDLISTIATVPGVRDLTLAAPLTNQNVGQSQRALVGTIGVTQTI